MTDLGFATGPSVHACNFFFFLKSGALEVTWRVKKALKMQGKSIPPALTVGSEKKRNIPGIGTYECQDWANLGVSLACNLGLCSSTFWFVVELEHILLQTNCMEVETTQIILVFWVSVQQYVLIEKVYLSTFEIHASPTARHARLLKNCKFSATLHSKRKRCVVLHPTLPYIIRTKTSVSRTAHWRRANGIIFHQLLDCRVV